MGKRHILLPAAAKQADIRDPVLAFVSEARETESSEIGGLKNRRAWEPEYSEHSGKRKERTILRIHADPDACATMEQGG